MTVIGLSGTQYQLDSKKLSDGGEGTIYRVVGGSNKTVAKIYKDEVLTKELEEKLKYMVNRQPSSSVLNQVAWPIDVIYDTNKKFLGFVMPMLSINAELGEIYKYPSQIDISVHQKLLIARNICVVIAEVHKAGYVFGDFNPRNIGVDKDNCTVAFLDTDSYHIIDGNTEYRCRVGCDGYIAPELLKSCDDFKASNPNEKDVYAKVSTPSFTKETDSFALAIHIFKLMMNGYTPFGGIGERISASQASPGIGNEAIRRNNYCFKPGLKPQAAAVPPLDAFPEEIAELFSRSFMVIGKIDPKQRPSAIEWRNALDNYIKDLITCVNDPLHHYSSKNTFCPYCKADQDYRDLLTPNKQIVYNPLNTPVQAPSTSNKLQKFFDIADNIFQVFSKSQTNYYKQVNKLKRILTGVKVAAVVVLIGIVVLVIGSLGGLFKRSSSELGDEDIPVNGTIEENKDVALDKSKKAYQNGVQAFANGKYEKAINEFRKVIERDDNYDDAQAKLTEAVISYKNDLFASLPTTETIESYNEIIKKLNYALVIIPADSDITTKLTYYNDLVKENEKEYVLGQITEIKNKADSSRDYDGCITLFKSLLKEHPAFDTEINSEIAVLTVKLIETVEIKLEHSTLSLESGKTAALRVVTSPADIINLDYTWESSDTSVATVSGGDVTAKGFGTANISLKTSDGTVRATCEININAYLGKDIKAYKLNDLDEFPSMGSFSIAGVEYTNGLKIIKYSGSAYYNLNGLYTNMSGLYGCFDSDIMYYSDQKYFVLDSKSTINIYGDDNLLVGITAYLGEPPKSFNLDITGVKELKIEIKDSYGCLADVVVSNNVVSMLPSNPDYTSKGTLKLGTDIRTFQSIGGIHEHPLKGNIEMEGTNYSNGLSSYSWSVNSGGKAYFNINGQYTSMTGVYGPFKDTKKGRCNINIYGDGKVLKEYVSINGESPVPFDVNIAGVNILVLEIRPEYNNGYGDYAVADVEFKK